MGSKQEERLFRLLIYILVRKNIMFSWVSLLVCSIICMSSLSPSAGQKGFKELVKKVNIIHKNVKTIKSALGTGLALPFDWTFYNLMETPVTVDIRFALVLNCPELKNQLLEHKTNIDPSLTIPDNDCYAIEEVLDVNQKCTPYAPNGPPFDPTIRAIAVRMVDGVCVIEPL